MGWKKKTAIALGALALMLCISRCNGEKMQEGAPPAQEVRWKAGEYSPDAAQGGSWTPPEAPAAGESGNAAAQGVPEGRAEPSAEISMAASMAEPGVSANVIEGDMAATLLLSEDGHDPGTMLICMKGIFAGTDERPTNLNDAKILSDSFSNPFTGIEDSWGEGGRFYVRRARYYDRDTERACIAYTLVPKEAAGSEDMFEALVTAKEGAPLGKATYSSIMGALRKMDGTCPYFSQGYASAKAELQEILDYRTASKAELEANPGLRMLREARAAAKKREEEEAAAAAAGIQEGQEGQEGTGGTESAEAAEAIEGIEGAEGAENAGGTEATEATESTGNVGGTEATEATESTGNAGGTEATESTGNAEGAEWGGEPAGASPGMAEAPPQ